VELVRMHGQSEVQGVNAQDCFEPKTAIIYTGEPIDLSAKLPRYRENRKECIAETLEELTENYLQCIENVKKNNGENRNNLRS
jgi:hypothetical protein